MQSEPAEAETPSRGRLERRSSRYEPASPDPEMLRPLDTLLLALGRYGSWARARMVYRALVVLAAPERAQPRR